MNSAIYWSAKVPCNVDTDLTCVDLVESIQEDARAELIAELAQLTSQISQLDSQLARANEIASDLLKERDAVTAMATSDEARLNHIIAEQNERLAVAVTALEKCSNALHVRVKHVVYTSECQCSACKFELMARESIKAYETALRFLGEKEGE